VLGWDTDVSEDLCDSDTLKMEGARSSEDLVFKISNYNYKRFTLRVRRFVAMTPLSTSKLFMPSLKKMSISTYSTDILFVQILIIQYAMWS